MMMIFIKVARLRRIGIKANVLGTADKSGYVLLPVVLFFVYAALSLFLNLPFPDIARKVFWKSDVLYWVACSICSICLLLLWFTLISFGHSFRMGIDKQTKDKLITTGAFTYSRNPVFTIFMLFFLGIFLAYPNPVSVLLLLLSMILIHRQILREESFLKKHYKKEYEVYCSRVRRYF